MFKIFGMQEIMFYFLKINDKIKVVCLKFIEANYDI